MSGCENCKKLSAQIKALQADFETKLSTFQAEISQLKDKLSTNSNNSGLPPSKDLRCNRKQRSKRTVSGRNPGGQAGHKGNFRDLSQPNEIIDVFVSDICKCGGFVEALESAPAIHQKVEIPPISPVVKEYRLHKGICTLCSKVIVAPLPEGVGYDLLGNNTKTIITTLTGFFNNSRRQTQKLLNDIFGLKISLGLVSSTEGRVSNKCESLYNRLCDELTYQTKLHIDETSNNSSGQRGWSWIFAGNDISVLKWTHSRSKQVLADTLPNFDGHVISDRYGAYYYFDESKRQVCWAHLLRDFEKFFNSSFPGVSGIGWNLKHNANELFAIWHAYKREEIPKYFFLRRCRKIRRRIYRYLQQMSVTDASDQARRVANNMLKCETMMWHFLDDVENIPMTNNHAEQQIRRFVIARKNSFFAWSDRGERFVERMNSIYLTYQKRNFNPFSILTDIINDRQICA